jgi:hypothetical protein
VTSSEANASQLTLFVVDQPTSFLDSGMLDPFATSAVSLNVEMNGVILHCESTFSIFEYASLGCIGGGSWRRTVLLVPSSRFRLLVG